MTTITFDTHDFIKRLQAVGFSEEQAEVFAQQQRELIEDRLVTQDHLEIKLVETRAELIKWMAGLAFAQIALLISILLVVV